MFGKVKITGENRNEGQPIRTTKRLGGCKRSEDSLGKDRLKMCMDGPAVFVHREGFNHISLVTLLNHESFSAHLFFRHCSPDRRLVLLISFYLAAVLRTYAMSVRVMLLGLRLCALLVSPRVTVNQHHRYSIPAGWNQGCSGDIPLPNPSNVAGQTESRMWFSNMGPTLFPFTSMAKLPLTFVFVLSEP